MDRQCPSCGGFCKKSGCERENTKPEHEWVELTEEEIQMGDAKERLVRIMGTFDLATGHADTMDQALDSLEEELRDVLGYLRARREWVGLTDDEIAEYWGDTHAGNTRYVQSFARALEATLKEKNGG